MPYTPARGPRPPRQLKWPLLVLIDVVLIGVALVIFALFDHVIPRGGQKVVDATYAPPAAYVTAATPQPTGESGAQPADQAVAEPDAPAVTETPQPVDVASMGDFSARFPDKFTSGEVIATDTSYQSANVNVTLTRYDSQYGSNLAVYYIEDIYIRHIDCLRTVFAEDTYGKSYAEGAVSMSQRTGSVAAINGDYYGVGTAGIVIRNGVLYRREFEVDEEVLVIYRDGRLVIYHHPDDLDLDRAMAEGAWQAFSFGPGFFDDQGGIQVTVKKGLHHDPRTVIGMVEPGHYIFMVADGRQEGYSDGMTYDECAEVMKSLGCVVAYNLDGGQTSQMTFMGEMANKPVGGGRATSEMILIVDQAG